MIFSKHEMKRVAVYGGSFNPIHSGHLEIIIHLSKHFDKVVIIPTEMKYYKRESALFSFERRCEMIEDNIETLENVWIDTIEHGKPETWKFIDSLKHVIENEPNSTVYVAMGSDCLKDFKNWYHWEEILRISKLLVFTRPGYTENLPTDVEYELVEMNNDESSTKIREQMNLIYSTYPNMNRLNSIA